MTSDGTNAFHWDAEDRLIKIVYQGTDNRSELTYDALGRCVKIVEITAGSTTSTKQFVWCGSSRCEERNASNAVTAQFFDLGQTDGTNDFFYNKDHLGSIREMTNSSGTVVWQQSFSPFGVPTTIVSTTPADFGYGGMYVHARSGLNLTLFRAYDPKLGRWLSRDPLGESAGVGLYAYVGNDPIGHVDRLGLKGVPVQTLVPKATAATAAAAGGSGLTALGAMASVGAAAVAVGVMYVFVDTIEKGQRAEDCLKKYREALEACGDDPCCGKKAHDDLRKCLKVSKSGWDKIMDVAKAWQAKIDEDVETELEALKEAQRRKDLEKLRINRGK